LEYRDCKERFIDTWGKLGPQWGVNKTMAQIHALLMVASEPMNADQVMSELDISSGNSNMNLRALAEWGLVYKTSKEGERCEYYYAEKNVHKIFKQMVSEINNFAHKADNALELLLKTDSHWFYNTLMKML
jgi:DNA-binding transcriptional regulator GbsR (MarR family)